MRVWRGLERCAHRGEPHHIRKRQAARDRQVSLDTTLQREPLRPPPGYLAPFSHRLRTYVQCWMMRPGSPLVLGAPNVSVA